jgi:DNA polymerase-4
MLVTPTILHADCDAFFASVAQRDDPALLGKPTVVGSWVVMAASYEARAFGVRSGMSTAKARRLCPDLLIAESRFEQYVAASREVFAVFEHFAPKVEAGSMEEAFLDLAGSPWAERPEIAAARLRRVVREQVGLPLSVGVARTKILAKLASRAAKPDGLRVIDPGRELEFLHPLDIGELWGVGPATTEKLRRHGLRTVGQVAGVDEAGLMAILGKASGRYVYAVAQNRDFRPVRHRRGRRSFGAQRALGGPRSRESGYEALATVCERVAARMARKQRAGRTVTLRLRFGDYTRATRSRTLSAPTAEPEVLLAAGKELLDAAHPLIDGRGLTLVGITVSGLTGTEDDGQMALDLG